MFVGDCEVCEYEVDFVGCQEWDVVCGVGWLQLQFYVEFVGECFCVIDVEIDDVIVFCVDIVEWWIVVECCDVQYFCFFDVVEMVCMGDGVCGNECDFDELCSECVDFYEYDLICYGGCCGLCGGMV